MSKEGSAISTPALRAASAPVPSLGLVLAGCPACRLPLSVDGAPRLAEALAAHQRHCPKRRPADDVCPRCGCEAELIRCASGWRCGDCLAETRLTDPAIPAPAAAAAPPSVHRPMQATPDDPAQVLAHTPRRQHRQRRRRRPAQRAVVA
jgi:ribosomal protein L37AE/L43A